MEGIECPHDHNSEMDTHQKDHQGAPQNLIMYGGFTNFHVALYNQL